MKSWEDMAESACKRCKHLCVISEAEPATRDYPGSPAELECDLGNDANFGSRYGCWEWEEVKRYGDDS